MLKECDDLERETHEGEWGNITFCPWLGALAQKQNVVSSIRKKVHLSCLRKNEASTETPKGKMSISP